MARFVLFGAWNTVFGYSVFIFLYYLFSKATHYVVILAISSVIGITNAYICYKTFVFKTKGNVCREYFKFYGVYGVTALFNLALLPLIVEVTHCHPVLAQGIIMGGAVCLSYFGHKNFSFRTGKSAEKFEF